MLVNLKKLREENGTTQRQLAEAIGVSQQSVNKYENHNIEPDIETLTRIARYYATSIDYVVAKDGQYNEADKARSIELTDAERRLIIKYRKLSPQQRACIDLVLDSYNK